ncbi:hemerythrin family protein [Candidatus Peregrinibacteria bacterium]|nr:hemerythrin family protein [Candidatus Peregrinibacteria bacterium]
MTCVQWNQSYNVDVKEIDGQHQKLVGIMNKLCESIDGGVDDFVIDEIVQDMADYALTHFETEEKYFREFDYKKTDEHIAQHREFSQKVLSLQKDLREDKRNVSADAIGFLGQWFAEHVLKYDREYVECFHEHGLY